MFSNLSSSSISLATVTPSLVIVGDPQDFSSTTLCPLGPRVDLTALARMSTPFNIFSLALLAYLISLAAIFSISFAPLTRLYQEYRPHAARGSFHLRTRLQSRRIC